MATLYAKCGSGLTSPMFGPDGKLFVVSSQSGEILSVSESGVSTVVNTSGIPTVCSHTARICVNACCMPRGTCPLPLNPRSADGNPIHSACFPSLTPGFILLPGNVLCRRSNVHMRPCPSGASTLWGCE
eukprot:scaffold26836_cov157-Isochrysis_galbana.AAC.2